MRLSSPSTFGVAIPKFTILQNNRLMGEFGYDGIRFNFPPTDPRLRNGFDWDYGDNARLAMPITRPIQAISPDSSWDPSQAFTLVISESPSVTVSHIVPAAGVPGNYLPVPTGIAGQWWNPDDPGWGLVLDRNERGTVYAAWLTYDTNGESTWFAMTFSAPDPAGGMSGDVYRHSGPTYAAVSYQPAGGFIQPYGGTHITGERVGRFRLEFTDADHGTFHAQIGTVTQRHPIQRLVVRDNKGNRCKGTQGTWTVTPVDSGWGIGLEGNASDRHCNLHMNFISYDHAGKPVWFFGGLKHRPVMECVGCLEDEFAGPVYRPSGRPYTAPMSDRRFDLGGPVGTMALKTDIANYPGRIYLVRYTIDGQTRRYSMTKFNFDY